MVKNNGAASSREGFTDKDTFAVEFSSEMRTPRSECWAAAALFIDLQYLSAKQKLTAN